MSRLAMVALIATLALAACSGTVATGAEEPGPDRDSPQAAALTDPEPLPIRQDDGLDGGELPAAGEPTSPAFGPGLDHESLAAHVQSIAVAEAWLAELEVEWDNGMTYSEIFRAWRSVSAETGPVLTAFSVPADADEIQTAQLQDYHSAVQGAHDEWQATVDFIVTYITNYTPEILITKAYQDVEAHLRDAVGIRESLGVGAAERPEIVIAELDDI